MRIGDLLHRRYVILAISGVDYIPTLNSYIYYIYNNNTILLKDIDI